MPLTSLLKTKGQIFEHLPIYMREEELLVECLRQHRDELKKAAEKFELHCKLLRRIIELFGIDFCCLYSSS